MGNQALENLAEVFNISCQTPKSYYKNIQNSQNSHRKGPLFDDRHTSRPLLPFSRDRRLELITGPKYEKDNRAWNTKL